jgi:single-strand DNA-binding protein
LIGANFKKGRPILIEGRLKLDQWDDKRTGEKRSKLMAVVETFTFVDRREDGPGDGPPPGRGRTVNRPAARPDAPVGQGSVGPTYDDSDVPF